MKIFTVTAERGLSGWWVLECAEVGAVSQARSLRSVDAEMREAIAHQAGLPEDAFAIHVDVVLPGKYYELQERARQLRSEAETANAAAAEASRAAARTLASEGMSLRDIGAAMGVSFQRAQQLVSG